MDSLISLKSDKFVNVMVDTETVGLANDAGIWQIGAHVFGSAVNMGALNSFQFSVFPGIYTQYPQSLFSFDPETIKWQEEKNTENWGAVQNLSPEVGYFDLAAGFGKYLEDLSEFYGLPVRLWFKGVDFDLPKLQHLFKQAELKTPWHYRNVMCCRTLFNLTGYQVPNAPGAHQALVDAIHQAQCVEHMFNQLGWEI